MTSFARVSVPFGKKKWAVEVRSVNQRSFELSLRLPPQLLLFEAQTRQMVQRVLRRGKVTVSLGEDGKNGGGVFYKIDPDQVRGYLVASGQIKKKFSLPGSLSVETVMRLPGVVKEASSCEDQTWTWPKLSAILKKGLDRAVLHRQAEGKRIEEDLRSRLQHISQLTQGIAALVRGNEKAYFDKLKGRLKVYLNEGKIDEERLYREAAFLAERSDITEELVRMRSHVGLFTEWLSRSEDCGRELDFLCQEMNREVNTMASKAQLFEVSKETIAIKSEIEKIREQVQNVA
ncbi:MAG: YicC family protein [Candidatus Omnitrophica bacterium]|nr:YicC family protein [Candidatus Omnitrophota bacterium]